MNFSDWNTYFGLIGIIAFLFSIWQYFKTKSETKITLYIQDLIPIISESLKKFKDFRIKVIESDIEVDQDVYHLKMFLKNTGNVDIARQKIFKQIKISVPVEIQILDYKIESYPSSIKQEIKFIKSKNEFIIAFQLLKKGELIQFDLIIHVPQKIKNEKKLKSFFQVQNFAIHNTVLNGRIENCKELEFGRIPKEAPRKIYLKTISQFLMVAILYSLLYILITQQFYVSKNLYRDIQYGKSYYGRISFINNDSLIIYDIPSKQQIVVNRKEFDRIGFVGPYHKKKIWIPELVFMIGGLILSFGLISYIHFRRAQNKKSIYNFIRKMEE